jgi:hypothetical protein
MSELGGTMRMAYNARRIFYYATTGVLSAIILIALTTSTPMILEYINPKEELTTGTLLVKLMDAPVELEELWVNITSLETNSKEQGWIELTFVDDPGNPGNPLESLWVDILTLQNVTMDLSITEIPLGNYTKLRMYVNAASANFTGPEEELVPLTVPPEKIDIKIHFEIKAGQTTELLVDMQADWVSVNKNHKLRPVLKAVVNNQP